MAKKVNSTNKSNKCGSFIAKFTLVVICYIAFYAIYLDGQIRSKMDGQVWQLPAEVYSRIEKISLEQELSLSQTKQILLEHGYRQTTMLAAPKDFKIEENTLTLLRESFPFPHQAEPQRVLRLRFQQDQLQVIEDLVKVESIDRFQLAPKLIGMLQSGKEERLAIKLQHYPRLLIDTLLLTEDRRFFQHEGISLLGIARAMVANIQAGQRVQGGSTLTQQLVKNLFLTNDRTFKRKFNEAWMALLLDWRYDKNKILETYLNEIYLGQNGDTQIHGFELASHFYFGRSTREISLEQIALLVGMVKGPSLYNPWRNPQKALERRNVVLGLLLEHKVIDQELFNMLSQRPLGVQQQGQINRKYPAFMQTLQAELRNQFGDYGTNSLSGTRIFSTLDVKQQEYAERAVVESTFELQRKHKNPYLQTAMVVADYQTGEVRAVVGGNQPHYAGLNRALNAKRQIGSLVKPSVYLTALSTPEQFRLNTPIQNQPITIHVKGSPPWQPRNYDRKYGGSVMLVDALARSLNVPTVNIGMKVGLTQVIETQKMMGWDNISIPKVPSMLLGSYTISPYEVTRLYQTIANQGKKIPLATIENITDQQGKLLYQRALEPSQVVPPQAAYQTLYAMQQVVERGTARSLQNEFAHLTLAGKTGTTNDARDTWFVGIDGKHITTVWLGRDDNGETKLTGASGALQIYHQYLKQAQPLPFRLKSLEQIQWVGIDPHGGWDCSSGRTIPVWTERNQNFCQTTSYSTDSEHSQQSNQHTNQHTKQESLWDVLDQAAPVEEAMPAN